MVNIGVDIVDFVGHEIQISSLVVTIILIAGIISTISVANQKHKNKKDVYAYYNKGTWLRNITEDSNVFQWTPLVYEASLTKNVFHLNPNNRQYLKQKIMNLTQASKTKDKSENACVKYYQDVLIPKFVMPNFYGKCRHHSRTKISLLLQMEINTVYLQKLKLISKNWQSSISVVFYFPKSQDHFYYTKNFYKRRIGEVFDTYQLHHSSICVHVVVSEEKPKYFPINSLRNIATRFAHTELVVMSEADFIPPPNLDITLSKHSGGLQHQRKAAYVIPVFGTLHNNGTFPRNKQELLELWKNNITVPIHELKDTTEGHVATNYSQYQKKLHIYEVNYKRHYEPYYMVNRRIVPSYPEILSFGFRDKCVHAWLLHNIGFEFFVLPDTFMVHTPHGTVYNRDYRTVRCADEAYKDITDDLRRMKT